MAKGCGATRAWRTDNTVVGEHNLAPVSCDQYIQALEAALVAVTLSNENYATFDYNPVEAVQLSLGIGSDANKSAGLR